MSFWMNGILTLLKHSELSNAQYHYVNKNGNDLNNGLTPETAKLTIQAGVDVLSEGDRLIIGPGTYTENINISTDFTQFFAEWGVSIVGTINISSFANIIEQFQALPSSGNGYNITGNSCEFVDCSALAGVIGFNITGFQNRLIDCRTALYTQTGFNIENFNIIMLDCIAIGIGTNTRGYYFSDPAADSCLLSNCISNRNFLAGYEVVAGCNFNFFRDCISGSGDGKKIDENSTNIWVNFQDELPQQHNEYVYPLICGDGSVCAPVAVNNLATNDAGGTRTDQWYFGDTITIIPKDGITEEYKFFGLNINANTANKDIMFQLLFTNGIEASQNGGNDWDQGETVITVDDASSFLVDDWIWVTGDDEPNGEIMKITNIASNVITLVRETTASAGTGLRYDYDITPGNNMIYLVHRPTNTVFHKIDDNFSASSAKDFIIYRLSEIRTISANGACLIRCSNGTDSLTVNFEVRAKIET